MMTRPGSLLIFIADHLVSFGVRISRHDKGWKGLCVTATGEELLIYVDRHMMSLCDVNAAYGERFKCVR